MIFVTVGSMFPFDRLILAMDEWTAANGRDDVFAQIGNGSFQPKSMRFVRRLSQSEFNEAMATADVIVSHAGMGTVITAGRLGQPVVLLPRIFEWGEHTSAHQIATANWLRSKTGIFVADTDGELPAAIDRATKWGERGTRRFQNVADPAFTDRLRGTILQFLNQTDGST